MENNNLTPEQIKIIEDEAAVWDEAEILDEIFVATEINVFRSQVARDILRKHFNSAMNQSISIIDELVNKAASIKDTGIAHKRAKEFLSRVKHNQ